MSLSTNTKEVKNLKKSGNIKKTEGADILNNARGDHTVAIRDNAATGNVKTKIENKPTRKGIKKHEKEVSEQPTKNKVKKKLLNVKNNSFRIYEDIDESLKINNTEKDKTSEDHNAENSSDNMLQPNKEREEINKDNVIILTGTSTIKPKDKDKECNEKPITNIQSNQNVGTNGANKKRIRQKELLKPYPQKQVRISNADEIKRANRKTTPKLKIKYVEDIIKKKFVPTNRVVPINGLYSYRENLRYVQNQISGKRNKMSGDFNKLGHEHWKLICEKNNLSFDSCADSVYYNGSSNINIDCQVELEYNDLDEIIKNKKVVRFNEVKKNNHVKRITKKINYRESSSSNESIDSKLDIYNNIDEVENECDVAFKDLASNIVVDERIRKADNYKLNTSMTEEYVDGNYVKENCDKDITAVASTSKSEAGPRRYNLRNKPTGISEESASKKETEGKVTNGVKQRKENAIRGKRPKEKLNKKRGNVHREEI